MEYDDLHQKLLLQENEAEVRALFPLIFSYASMLSIGVLGNALVLLVYSVRYKHSPARVYILFLASIDFTICLFGLPYHLIDLSNPYTYTDELRCQILTFIISSLFYTSIFGLIVIAIDRYLKICHPLATFQMTWFGKNRACGVAMALGVALAWPNLILYGPSEMETSIANVTGHACFFHSRYAESIYPFVYSLITLTICICSMILLTVLYTLICHHIVVRYKGSLKVKWATRGFEDSTVTDDIPMKTFTQSTPVRSSSDLVNTDKKLEEQALLIKNELLNYYESEDIHESDDNMNTHDIQDHEPIAEHFNDSSRDDDIDAADKSNHLVIDDPTPVYCPENKDDGHIDFVIDNDDHSKPLIDKHATKAKNGDKTTYNAMNGETNNHEVNGDCVEVADDKKEIVKVHKADSLGNTGNKMETIDVVKRSGKNDTQSVDKVNDHMHIIPERELEIVSNGDTKDTCDGSFEEREACINKKRQNCGDTNINRIDSKSMKLSLVNKRVKELSNGVPQHRHSFVIRRLTDLSKQTSIERRNSDMPNRSKFGAQRVIKSKSLTVLNQNSTLSPPQNAMFEGLRIHTSNVNVCGSNRSSLKIKQPMTRQHYKITKIMLIVTTVFLLSYTPALVITIWSTIDPGIWDTLTEQETILFEFLLRFYLVNNVCNPFIYGFWDKRFKREVIFSLKKVYRRIVSVCTRGESNC